MELLKVVAPESVTTTTGMDDMTVMGQNPAKLAVPTPLFTTFPRDQEIQGGLHEMVNPVGL